MTDLELGKEVFGPTLASKHWHSMEHSWTSNALNMALESYGTKARRNAPNLSKSAMPSGTTGMSTDDNWDLQVPLSGFNCFNYPIFGELHGIGKFLLTPHHCKRVWAPGATCQEMQQRTKLPSTRTWWLVGPCILRREFRAPSKIWN